ncbi:MAG: PAS domain S-box protein [bacterium]|nr:PAS domain S-box protein [bacterium]
MKLSTKLFSGFFLGSLIPIIFLAFIFYNDLFRIIKSQHITEKQQEMLLRKELTEYLLQQPESSINLLSKLSGLRDYINNQDTEIKNTSKIEGEFQAFMNENSMFSKLTFIDTTGQEIVNVNWDGNTESRLTPANLLKNIQTTYYFENTMKLKNNEIFVSLLKESENERTTDNSGEPIELTTNTAHKEHSVIAYYMPIFNDANQIKGIIALDIFSEFILESFNHEHAKADDTPLSTIQTVSQEITIINNDGYYLHHPTRSKEWGFIDANDQTLFNDMPQIQPLIMYEKSGQLFDEESKSFVIFNRLKPFSDNVKAIHMGLHSHSISEAENFIQPNSENIYWVQTITIPESKILDQVNILFFKTLSLILLVLMFFIVGMVVFLQRIILNPIERIIQGAERIKKGNLDYKLSLGNRKDEFGDLANEFNSMSAVLKRYKETMEQKIDERTADLIKFKNAIESSVECIIITNTEGVVLYVNDAVEHVTGYSKNEVINQKVGTNKLWGGVMGKDFYDKLWKTIKTDKKSFTGKVKNKNKNGAEYTALLSISLMLDKEGELLYFLGIESNLSETE